MHHRLVWSVLVTVSTCLFCAKPASAQLLLSPYGHVNFGDVEARRGGVGLSLGYLDRWLGFEVDAGYHSHFYKDRKLEGIPNPCGVGVSGRCVDSNTDAVILAGRLVAPIPVFQAQHWQIYGCAGPSLIHAWIHNAGEYNSTQNYFALNAGAGTVYWIVDWFGVVGDVKWFHAFVGERSRRGAGYFEDFDFARISLGVTFAPFNEGRKAGTR